MTHNSKILMEAHQLSREAQDRLDTQVTHVKRQIIARALLLAALSNDDFVLPSHVEAACKEVLGKPSHKARIVIALISSAVMGGVLQGLFGGVGKSVGEYLFRFF
jgi:hypothetical protein